MSRRRPAAEGRRVPSVGATAPAAVPGPIRRRPLLLAVAAALEVGWLVLLAILARMS